MAEGYFHSQVLAPSRVGDALSEQRAYMERDKHFQRQLAEQQQMDDYRKSKMIADAGDLSKYQTGSDVVNAIGNDQINAAIQELTAGARNMSFLELQSKIQQKTSSIYGGMQAAKSEFELADAQLKQLKQLYPNLDVGALASKFRQDIVDRRVDKGGGTFVNPMQVTPSQIDLSNPEFLSDYISGGDNLRKYFSNPQGLDETTVFKGTPESFTTYKGKVPSWRKPNYDPSKLKEGFLPKSAKEPSLDFKSETVLPDVMPSSKDTPFEMMDKQEYDNIKGVEKLELIAATKRMFPGYKDFNPQEKEFAQRKALLDAAKQFDKTGFMPTARHNPSASLLRFYAGDSGSGAAKKEVAMNDLYKRLNDLVPQNGYKNFNDLDADMQEQVKKIISNTDSKISGEEVIISRGGPDNKLGVFWGTDSEKSGQPLVWLTPSSVNSKVQPGVAEEREVNKLQTQSSKGAASDVFTRAELKGAGWSDAQIDEAIKKKAIKIQ